MKSITLHGIDDALDRRIRERAVAEGKSLNRMIKGWLEESLGLRRKDHRAEFMDLFGTWSEEEMRNFEQVTADLRRILD